MHVCPWQENSASSISPTQYAPIVQTARPPNPTIDPCLSVENSRRRRPKRSGNHVFSCDICPLAGTGMLQLGDHPPGSASTSRSRGASGLLSWLGHGRLRSSSSRPTRRLLRTTNGPARLLDLLRLGLGSIRRSNAVRSSSAPRPTSSLALLRIEFLDQRSGVREVRLGLPRGLVQAVTLPFHVVHVLEGVGVDDRLQDLLNLVLPLRDYFAVR